MKNNHQNISNVRNSRILNSNINMNDSCYSVDDVVGMIKRGEIALSTETIKGVNGATYVRAPDHEIYNDEYDAFSTIFYLDEKEYPIPTVRVKGTEWYLFSAVLRMLNLLQTENDVSGFCADIPYQYKRLFTFKGHGYRRTYVTMEALEIFGISPERKVIVKKKVNLYVSGITTFRVNLPYLQQKSLSIMNKLDDLEDRIFMGDVYRLLSQLE